MATGSVRIWLRLEGAFALLLAAVFFAHTGGKWWLFLACFLLPDVTLFGSLLGPAIGSRIYNVGHSYVGPAVVALVCLVLHKRLDPALTWVAHIGFDRALGYGLKYPTAFGDTHLGKIGKPLPEAAVPEALVTR